MLKVRFFLNEPNGKPWKHFKKMMPGLGEKYEIEIVDGLNFKADRYFDIRSNSWKLDKLVPSVLEANKLCRELSHKKLWLTIFLTGVC